MRSFFEFAKKELKIENDDDWLRVSRDQITLLGGMCTFFFHE